MIEINLVPQNLRKKRKAQKRSWQVPILPKETITGIAIAFLVLLVFVHILLQGIISIRYLKYKKLSKQWDELLPDKTKVDNTLNELKILQNKIKPIEEAVGTDRILWSQKLNEISDTLVRGVWLTKIELKKDALVLTGSAVSKDNTEILSVHKFTAALKNNKEFGKHFSEIDVGIHNTSTQNSVSIADFTITANLEQ